MRQRATQSSWGNQIPQCFTFNSEALPLVVSLESPSSSVVDFRPRCPVTMAGTRAFFGRVSLALGVSCQPATRAPWVAPSAVNSEDPTLTFTAQVNTDNIVMWETLHISVDWDYFKILTLQGIWKIRIHFRWNIVRLRKSLVCSNTLDVQETDMCVSSTEFETFILMQGSEGTAFPRLIFGI